MEKVIFDCDNTLGLWLKEIDDGLTIYFLLGSPDLELLGVTTTFGNGTIDQVYQQTRQLMTCVGMPELPVLKGVGSKDQGPTEAARFLVDQVNQAPGEITILATGPLGNLRGAHQLDGDFFSKVNRIACMGGYLKPVRMGRRDVGELNLSADPEAAYQVLNASCPVVLMSAQICLQAPLGWKDLNKIAFCSWRTKAAVIRWLILHLIFTGLGHFYLWDLLPAVYLTNPELFSETRVSIISSCEDLERGDLILGERTPGSGLILPDEILDQQLFLERIVDAWRQAGI